MFVGGYSVVLALTLEAVVIEEVFTPFVTLGAALGTAKSLSCQTPEENLTLEAVGRRCGCPHDKVVRSSA
jgi:hypothetical protein